jgi:hypothetical protein
MRSNVLEVTEQCFRVYGAMFFHHGVKKLAEIVGNTK